MRPASTFVGLTIALALSCMVSAASADETVSTTETKRESSTSIPDFGRLRTPDSPAFVVLGVSPSEIQQPTTPKALAVSLLTNFTEGTDALIPRDFALEAAPYWMFHHPDLTYDEAREAGVGLIKNLSLSIATSTTEEEQSDTGDGPGDGSDATADESGAVDTTSVAIGLRSSLWSQYLDDPHECVGEINERLTALAGAISASAARTGQLTAPLNSVVVSLTQIEGALDGGDALANVPSELEFALKRLELARTRAATLGDVDTVAGVTELRDKLSASAGIIRKAVSQPDLRARATAAVTASRTQVSSTMDEIKARRHTELGTVYDSRREALLGATDVRKCRDTAISRVGFNVDWAAALSFAFPDQTFEDGKVSKVSGWLTAGLVGLDGLLGPDPTADDEGSGLENLSVFALGRYGVAGLDGDDETGVLDLGGRATLAWERYAVSAEAVYRRLLDAPEGESSDQYRIAAAFDARLYGDLWLTTTLGRDFDDGESSGALLALANFSWQLGDESVIPTPDAWADDLGELLSAGAE